MPNEEPEGPMLPPKKKAVIKKNNSDADKNKSIGDIINPRDANHIEIKGFIVIVVASIVLISYIMYYLYYYYKGIKLNELYFIVTGIGISVFTGLLFTFFKNTYVKTILLFTSIFYLLLEIIYIIMWIIYGQPYTCIKTSLIIGLLIGLTYFTYDKFNNKPRYCDK